MCASMKSPTSSFAVALYDSTYDPLYDPDARARSCSFGRSRTSGLGPVSRTGSAPPAARIADNDPKPRATVCGCFRVVGVNPDVRRRTTPRQYVLLRQPVRRVGRRRGARPGGGEKADGGRQASGERCERRDACRCCDGATKSQGKRMRGDEEMI